MTKPIALVTGASRGIGAAISKALANEHYFVIGTATSQDGAERISANLAEEGEGVVMDVSNHDSVVHALADIQARIGTVEVLVNNAGITHDNLFMRVKEDDWLNVIDTNLNGAYRLSHGVIRGMIKQRRGRIVMIGSVVGQMGNPGQTSYAAAKAGLSGLSKSLAKEVGARGITVNVVAPGYIQTDMTDALSDDQKAAINNDIPMGRMGTVDDISGLVCFLVSDQASYITGQTLSVNGGLHMI